MKPLKKVREYSMIRKYVIISGVLTFLAIAGLITTSLIPNQVQRDVPLVNYEQRGEFDYLVHLKPSYLFGPPPVEVPVTNPTYPAVIVDTIDFTFSYSTVSKEPGTARIDAVLENPDIWQKKLELVPEMNVTGSFDTSFKLNIGEIQGLFNIFEEEIQIPGVPRCVNINACVTTGAGQFVQSLPIKMNKTLIEVDSTLTQTGTDVSGRFSYSVNLKPNSIFETAAIQPTPVPEVVSDVTLKPGEIILTRLVDSIKADFSYQFVADQSVTAISTDVVITAVLDAPGLWTKEFPLVSERKGNSFQVSFPVELLDYLELIDRVRIETGASPDSLTPYTLTLNANVHVIARTKAGTIDKLFNQPLKGTLKGAILTWGKQLTKNEPGALTEKRVVSNDGRYLGLSINGIRTVTAVVTGCFLIVFILLARTYRKLKPVVISPTDKEIARIKKKYKQQVAEGTGEMPEQVEQIISMSSVEDLVVVASELARPIIHQTPATSGRPHTYYVLDGATRYDYFLTPEVETPETEVTPE
jgi:hypothetical protein